MPVVKLTGVVIQNLKPSDNGKRLDYFDTQHKRLCLRVGKRDKTWTYHYSVYLHPKLPQDLHRKLPHPESLIMAHI